MNQTPFASRLLRAALAALSMLCLTAPALAAGTLDRVRDSGKLTLGYRADARPFAFSEGGKPAGFSVALCTRIADAIKADLKLPSLQVEWVPVTATSRFELLQQGRIDLSCGTDTPTLDRRERVDFSIPIFLSGIGAAMRIDVDRRVRDALSGVSAPAQPLWRGNPGDIGKQITVAVVGGTSIEKSLLDRLRERRLEVTVKPVADYASGIAMLLGGEATVLFGDRPVLLDAAQRGPGAGQLLVLERLFTREMLALAMARDNDALRLVVDRTLSRFYRSPEMATLFTTWFGPPGSEALNFYRAVALPD